MLLLYWLERASSSVHSRTGIPRPVTVRTVTVVRHYKSPPPLPLPLSLSLHTVFLLFNLTEDSTQPRWQCQLMTFCNVDEMRTIQKLTEKSEFLTRLIHTKCANYLETKSYRCNKCENKNFIQRHNAGADVHINNLRVCEIYNIIRPYEVFKKTGQITKTSLLPY